jgi:RNA polymerase II subunit A C-terminal domain phosphatase SSU72
MEKSVAFVCASNQNRSMEAHALLKSKGYKNVRSFGTSMQCKLPGPRIDKPNIYPFGTPYKKIYEELKTQNPELFVEIRCSPFSVTKQMDF